jgi:TolB protein
MKKLVAISLTLSLIFVLAASHIPYHISHIPAKDTLSYPEETHLQNIQQLTFGGDNAEAYFSFDGKWLIFQRTQPKDGLNCDQMFIGKIPQQGERFEYKMVSTGKGRTTCGFFTKDGRHVIYASTHLGSNDCPPVPDRSKYGNRYIWPLYASFDIFMARWQKNDLYQCEGWRYRSVHNGPSDR